jgi:hypothetical protein
MQAWPDQAARPGIRPDGAFPLTVRRRHVDLVRVSSARQAGFRRRLERECQQHLDDHRCLRLHHRHQPAIHLPDKWDVPGTGIARSTINPATTF